MGNLEKESAKRKKREKRENLRKYILTSVQLAGILSIGLIAPNALGAMAKLGILPSKRAKESVGRSREQLVRKGFLQYDGKFLRLTEKGEKLLRHLDAKNFQIKKPKRWDGKWRVLIFDIPQARKGLRDKVRRTLVAIGFIRLQNSVWIYPYDCEDLITLLKADFKIGKDTLYMIVESLEYDAPLKKRFGL